MTDHHHRYHTNRNHNSTPPSVISIRSSGSSPQRVSSSSSAAADAEYNTNNDGTKSGVDLSLIGVVQVGELKDPEPRRSVVVGSIRRRRSNSSGAVSFALEEASEDEEVKEEEEEVKRGSVRMFDLCDTEDACDGIHSYIHRKNDRDSNSSIVIPDIDVEEPEEETSSHSQEEQQQKVQNDRLQMILLQVLEKYMAPARNGLSSDYWKGLLVGLYVCQAIVVPLWTAWTVSVTEGSQSFFGFLGLMLRKLIAGAVASAGFLIVAVVAIKYDRTLQKELDDLREAADRTGTVTTRTPPRPRRASQPTRSSSPVSTQTQPRHAPVASLEEEPNNAYRSVSVTAPSTASDAGSDSGKEHQDKPNHHKRSDAKAGNHSERQSPTQPQIQNIVNFTPDTMREVTMKEDKSLSFSGHILTDLSEPSERWASASTRRAMQPTASSQSQQPPRLPPAAAFYPDATVLIAHVSGFAAWSSQRDPDQVFHLLERLHQRFDEAAAHLQITKVDTTSNEYMAVTGVPQPQKDHAIRMVKFAKQIMSKMVTIVTALEATLGPGTTELRLRIGIHSGSVTAGNLGGRFEVLGQTVKTAAIMESSCFRHRIQVSETTAELLRKGGKEDWIQKREDPITSQSEGGQSTYFILMTAPLTARNKSSYHGSKSNASLRSMRSTMSGVTSNGIGTIATDQKPQVPKRRQVWGDGEDNFIMSLPPMSRTARNKRLVGWVNKLLSTQLKKVVVQRTCTGMNGFEITDEVLARVCHGEIPLEEVADVSLNAKRQDGSDRSTISGDLTEVTLDANISSQLRELIANIADLYHDENPFHDFEHASHVTMSVQKLLSRCIAQDDDECDAETSSKSAVSISASATRQYMSGVANDALCQFAILFAALVHDCGHQGLSSRQLSRLNPDLSEKYDHESVAEQHSIELAWSVLMDRKFHDLQKCLFSSEDDVQRFRQILINCVLATDLSNSKAQALRNRRWEKAFQQAPDSAMEQDEDSELKANVVIECLVEASDISHTMQHWKIYSKWNERLFREKSMAFDSNRSFCNPLEIWFQAELDFLDQFAIPLAKKLAESKVFGVASNECLYYAEENRKIWAEKGKEEVTAMFKRFCKRKEMEIGGFTNEEINNFTAKELEYIMKKLVEKGRYQGSTQMDGEKGQNDAAQAWLDALEIYERSPASMEISDRSIIFPIYSGVYVWTKGHKIPTDPDGYFELNLAQRFARESKLHLDPIHYTRALEMLSQVYGRQGNYKRALEEFAKLKDIYSQEAHSLPIAEVYGQDRAAQAFSYSAIWYDQLGDTEKALAACEHVISDLLPAMDPENTLGNFELLYNVIRVMKPRGQEKRMKRLLEKYVVGAFQKHHGPNGFTPCMFLFKPLLWLLGICSDPSRFEEMDDAVQWLVDGDNGVMDEFVDSIFTNSGWAPNDIVAELCLRLANRLALESRDLEYQRILIEKGLMLAWVSERRTKDKEGNIVIPVAYEIHEPVFNALCAVARQMGISCEDSSRLERTAKMLDVNLPRSYLQAPDEETEM